MWAVFSRQQIKQITENKCHFWQFFNSLWYAHKLKFFKCSTYNWLWSLHSTLSVSTIPTGKLGNNSNSFWAVTKTAHHTKKTAVNIWPELNQKKYREWNDCYRQLAESVIHKSVCMLNGFDSVGTCSTPI